MKPMNPLIKTASGFFKPLSRMVQDPVNTNPAKKIRGFKNVWIHPSTALIKVMLRGTIRNDDF